MSSVPPMPSETPSEKPKPRRSDAWLMFTKFLKDGTKIASFSPSSPYLARAMIRGIDFNQAKVIVELGAGTGPITNELTKVVQPGTKLIVIERDVDFAQRLRERFPTVDVIQGDAAKVEELLAERGIDKVDHFISGLPLPSFPKTLRDEVIASCMKHLAPEGTFRQLTVMPWVYYGLYKKYFSEVKFKFVARNLPPSGVYICRGYKHAAPATA